MQTDSIHDRCEFVVIHLPFANSIASVNPHKKPAYLHYSFALIMILTVLGFVLCIIVALGTRCRSLQQTNSAGVGEGSPNHQPAYRLMMAILLFNKCVRPPPLLFGDCATSISCSTYACDVLHSCPKQLPVAFRLRSHSLTLA